MVEGGAAEATRERHHRRADVRAPDGAADPRAHRAHARRGRQAEAHVREEDARRPRWPRRVKELCDKEILAASLIKEKKARYDALQGDEDQGRRGAHRASSAPRASRRSRSSSRRSSRSASTTSSASTCSRERKRIDGRDMKTIRPIVCEVGIFPRVARLGALPARRDAGGRHRDARHVERRAEDRRAHRRALEALHAPLQLPAVLDRRDQAAPRPGPPRDRPRRPRRARARRG